MREDKKKRLQVELILYVHYENIFLNILGPQKFGNVVSNDTSMYDAPIKADNNQMTTDHSNYISLHPC